MSAKNVEKQYLEFYKNTKLKNRTIFGSMGRKSGTKDMMITKGAEPVRTGRCRGR